MQKDTFSIFRGTRPTETGYGVKGSLSGVLHEADFRKEVAERVAQLNNSATPPEDWEATSAILEREGYDVKVTPSSYLREEAALALAAVAPKPTTVDTQLGDYKVQLTLDEDGHLNIVVQSKDGSPVVDTEDGPGCEDSEVSFRLTTENIEAAQLAG